jgi:hypothetical protein
MPNQSGPYVVTPTLATPQTNPYYSSGSAVTITGLCLTGDEVLLSGSATGVQVCANSAFSFNLSASVDGVYSYSVTQTDSGTGQVSEPAAFTWVRETSIAPPVLTAPTTNPFYSAESALVVSGSCETGATVAIAGGGPTVSGLCASSAFSLTVPESVDATYALTVSQTDPAGNIASIPLTWNKLTLSVTPSAPILVVNTPQVFTPAGGSGTYSISIVTNNSGGTLNSSTFTYTTGTLANQADVLKITDSLGASVTINVSTVAGAADHLEIGGGNSQNSTPGNLLTDTAEVQVVDRYGNGIPSVQLLFRMIEGDAQITSSPIEYSNASGDATATIRLGYAAISNVLEVSPLVGTLPDLAGTGNSILYFTETTQTAGGGTVGTLYATDSNPDSLLTVDLNGDGIPDAVVVDSGNSNVGVRLGLGDGLFGPLTRLTVCSGPSQAVAADFNGDGKIDLAVACSGSNKVSVMLGNGDGTFQTATSFSTSVNEPEPGAMVTADFNGDGKADLAVVSTQLNVVGIFFGNGDGTFTHSADYATGLTPVALAVADFNKDGHPDLVSANSGDDTVSVLLNSGTGTFGAGTAFSAGQDPVGLAVGDFNGDGYPDLAVVNEQDTNDSVSVFLNDKTGNLVTDTPLLAGTAPDAIATGDFNGDGYADLAVANGGDGTVEIFYGSGSGQFTANATFTVGNDPSALWAFDGNADGVSDLLIANAGDETFQFMPGQKSGLLGFTTATGTSASAIVTADFNGDGKGDLAILNPTTKTVSVLLGAGDGLFTLKSTLATGTQPSAAVALDINGDGNVDLIVANQGSSSIGVFLGNGDGTFQTQVTYPVSNGPAGIAVQDFNGDGKLDLAVADSTASHVSVLLGNGDGTFQTKTDYVTGAAPVGIVAADFNGDGKPDLATVNNTDGTVSILLGNGDGTFQTHVDYTVDTSPNAMAVGDFNGDGIPDLAVLSATDGEVSILLGNSDGSLRAKNDFSAGNSPSAIVTGDFNGDGKLDLAITDGTEATLSILLGAGNGNYNSLKSYTTNATVNGLSVGDFNGDGKLDLAILDGTNNVVQLWLGN